jgi:RimJ/RimL family protein N-acetyltransferase
MTDGGAIRTERLTLRPPRPEDAEPVFRGISDWEVLRWLTAPPHPYRLEHAVEFLTTPVGTGALVVEVEGAVAGIVGLHRDRHEPGVELGYWLARPFWGRGLMTEAAAAAVAWHFSRTDEMLHSGYLVGNSRSAGVLGKLGFRDTELVRRWSVPLQAEHPLQRMWLTAADWTARGGAPGLGEPEGPRSPGRRRDLPGGGGVGA